MVARAQIFRSRGERVAKAVFTRLMLEETSVHGVEEQLNKYDSLLPSHWFITSRSKIQSGEVRPTTVGFKVFDLPEKVSFHTNHFQRNRSALWSRNRSQLLESNQRLKRLRKFARDLPSSVTMCDLAAVLDRFRLSTKAGKRETEATIVIALEKLRTKVLGVDYFDGKPVRLPMQIL